MQSPCKKKKTHRNLIFLILHFLPHFCPSNRQKTASVVFYLTSQYKIWQDSACTCESRLQWGTWTHLTLNRRSALYTASVGGFGCRSIHTETQRSAGGLEAQALVNRGQERKQAGWWTAEFKALVLTRKK